MPIKQRAYEILEIARPGDRPSKVFDVGILVLIASSVLAVVLESVQSIATSHGALLHGFEVFCVIVFTVEYVLRVWTCTLEARYRGPVSGRLRFMRSPMAVVDLLAILPFYLTLIPIDLRFVRALRLMRLFRIVKIGRYSTALRTVGLVVTKRKEELYVTFAMLAMLVVLSSALMYYAEREANGNAFPSIPATMWWAIVTVTTVGYGDAFPVTELGRVIAGLTAVIGVLIFALPVAIFGGAFLEEITPKASDQAPSPTGACPHCGRELDETPRAR